MVTRTSCAALVTRNPTRIQAWLGLWNDGPGAPPAVGGAVIF